MSFMVKFRKFLASFGLGISDGGFMEEDFEGGMGAAGDVMTETLSTRQNFSHDQGEEEFESGVEGSGDVMTETLGTSQDLAAEDLSN